MKNFHSSVIEFYFQATKLKTIVRKGWEIKNIHNPESVADHTFGLLILALLFSKELNLDTEKVLTLALIHDISETITGDITPLDGISNAEKCRIEGEAVMKIFNNIPGEKDFLKLWEEYKSKSSPESKLVYELDKLELALQARRYETDKQISLAEFYQYALSNIEDKNIGLLVEEIKTYSIEQ